MRIFTLFIPWKLFTNVQDLQNKERSSFARLQKHCCWAERVDWQYVWKRHCNATVFSELNELMLNVKSALLVWAAAAVCANCAIIPLRLHAQCAKAMSCKTVNLSSSYIPCSNSNHISVKCGALCHDPCNTVTHSHSVFPKTSGFHNCVKTVSKDVSNRVFICQQLLCTGLRSKNNSTHELEIPIAPAILF